MAVLTYDPSQVSVVLGGNILGGFSDGTFVTIARNADMWSMKVGVGGQATRAKSSDKSGTITVVLQQSSPSNDDLSALIAADELTNAGAVPLLIRDASGRTLATALTAWVSRYPNVDFAKESTDRTYTLMTDSLEVFVGGN